MKSLLVTAALGVALVLSNGSAQALYGYKAPPRHNHGSYWRHSYGNSYENSYGSGSNIINSNCPAGTQPHVWPSASGYRCL